MLDTVEGMSELQRIRVVIADDQELVRAGFAMVIGSQPDIQVVGQAGDGAQAVSLAESLHPDVVLMDVRMPGMDGLETLRHVKEKAPGLPVILLTGHACMGVAVQGLDLGAYDYMLKPVAISELIIKMEEAVRSASRRSASAETTPGTVLATASMLCAVGWAAVLPSRIRRPRPGRRRSKPASESAARASGGCLRPTRAPLRP